METCLRRPLGYDTLLFFFVYFSNWESEDQFLVKSNPCHSAGKTLIRNLKYADLPEALRNRTEIRHKSLIWGGLCLFVFLLSSIPYIDKWNTKSTRTSISWVIPCSRVEKCYGLSLGFIYLVNMEYGLDETSFTQQQNTCTWLRSYKDKYRIQLRYSNNDDFVETWRSKKVY